jgi:hypothetical protein
MFTYGAFQHCPHCRDTTFISSHNFWRVFKRRTTLLIIILEMLVAPPILYLLYPRRMFEFINYPFSGLFDNYSDNFAYGFVFAIFVVVWILNLSPLFRYKNIIDREYES